jgi:hypothetical protein
MGQAAGAVCPSVKLTSSMEEMPQRELSANQRGISIIQRGLKAGQRGLFSDERNEKHHNGKYL